MSDRPLDILEALLDEPVAVLLKDGNAYFGVLIGYDQHMNIVLEEALDEDTMPRDIEPEQVQDTTIIRGDNVVTIKTRRVQEPPAKEGGTRRRTSSTVAAARSPTT